MPKTLLDWCIAIFIAAALVPALFRVRPLASPYCPRCKQPTLRRRPCAYANAPAEKATCANIECRHCFVETAYRILTYADDLAIVADKDEDY